MRCAGETSADTDAAAIAATMQASTKQRVPATRPDRRVVGREQRPELGLRQLDDGWAQRQLRRCLVQLFCLRSESMNLISSTTPS